MALSKDTRLGMISAFFRGWLRFCRRTSTLEVEGDELFNHRLIQEGRGAIMAVWHNRLVWATKWAQEKVSGEGRTLSVLVSFSKDGEIASRVSEDMGLDVVRGSSSRRGITGMRQLLRRARRDHLLCFVADGPRGPRYQSKRGVIEAARLTGFPIFPWSSSCSPAILLGSWDRMVAPLPFSKVKIRLGDPITVPRRATEEEMDQALKRLDRDLRELTSSLDEEFQLLQRSFAIGKARRQEDGKPSL